MLAEDFNEPEKRRKTNRRRGVGEINLHSPNQTNFSRRVVTFLLSYGVAGACLYWVFHSLNFRELFHSFREVNGWLLWPAVFFNLLVYLIAGWEWQILLRTAARVSTRQTTQAVFAGRFANDVLPVHVGYVVRIYLIAHWTRAKIASVAPSLMVERLFDGFWLAVGIGLAAIFMPLPGKIAGVAKVWAGIIAFGIAAAALILIRKPKTNGTSRHGIFRWKLARKIRVFFRRVAKQVRAIGRSQFVLAAFALSLVKFAAQALAFLFVLWSYGFHFSFVTQLTIFLIAYVGLSMPSTPASVGVFQLFCIAGLEMFHVPKPAAAGFALLAFVVLTVPLSLAGFFALAQSGLTLRQIRSEANEWKNGWSGSRN